MLLVSRNVRASPQQSKSFPDEANNQLRPVFPQLYPLGCVAHTRVLYQGPKHHEEADEEVNIYGLHVGDLRQGGIDRVAVGRVS